MSSSYSTHLLVQKRSKKVVLFVRGIVDIYGIERKRDQIGVRERENERTKASERQSEREI